jgi:hypothetical protein
MDRRQLMLWDHAVGAKGEEMRLRTREIFVHYSSGIGKSKLKIPDAQKATASSRQLTDGSPAYPPRHRFAGRCEVIVDNLTNFLSFFCLAVLRKIDDLRGHNTLRLGTFPTSVERLRGCLLPYTQGIVPVRARATRSGTNIRSTFANLTSVRVLLSGLL